MSKKINVNILTDGPMKISGFDSIEYCGEVLSNKDQVFLCRCGNSKNAPFCDGSHKTNGFNGKNETSDQQSIRIWEGKTIRTHFNANLCMHARKCQKLGELREFESIDGDLAAAFEIARIVTTCPSGALSYEMIDGKNEIEFKSSGIVEIMEGGEVRLKSEIEGTGIEAQENQPKNRLALCRCGLSKNKPFCDSSHTNKEGFR